MSTAEGRATPDRCVRATLKNVASGRLAVAAGAQKAQCMWKYMSISSTAGHCQTVAQSLFSVALRSSTRIAGPVGSTQLAKWWAHKDSNLEPKDYESSALTVEL